MNMPKYTIVRGNSDKREHVFVYTDTNGDLVPYDLSVFTSIRMDVRDKPYSKGRLIASLSLGSGLTIIGDNSNILKVEISAEQSLNFTKDKNKAYYYDIVFIDASGTTTLLRGIYEVISNITILSTP